MSIEGYKWGNLERMKAPDGTWGAVGKRCAVAVVVTAVLVAACAGYGVLVPWIYLFAACMTATVWVWVWLTSHRALKRMGYDFPVENRVGWARRERKTTWGRLRVNTVWLAVVLGLAFGVVGVGISVAMAATGTEAFWGVGAVTAALVAGGVYGYVKMGDDFDILDSRRKLAKNNPERLESVRAEVPLEESE